MKQDSRSNRYAKKSLGQNFLTDNNYISKIISALAPQKDELVFEIGPGRGALTRQLVGRAGKVIAIELDRDLAAGLKEELGRFDNFLLIENDALKIEFDALANLQGGPGKAKLVANLPYYISTAILQHLILYRHCFSQIVVMLQKEVVDRITAEPGNKERGFLTVLVKAYFKAERLFDVPPNAFKPVPKVTSTVLRLITTKNYESKIEDGSLFREIVSAGFKQKRKTIRNNLKSATGDLVARIDSAGGVEEVLSKAGVDPVRRAETLEIEEWIGLYEVLWGPNNF